MATNSPFTQTQSIVAFAQANNISNIELVHNKHTNLDFGVADDGTRFRVSKSIEELTPDLMVSWFTPEDGEPSWLIHPRGESNVKSTLSFDKAPSAKSKMITPF